MRTLLIIIFLVPLLSFAQVSFRQYKPGAVYRYRLSSEVFRNDKFSAKTISVSEHTVVKDTGVFAEEIRWLSKLSFTAKDSINLDSVAQKIKPYRVSLSPKGNVPLPKLTVPEMVGDITDLNTFFVAVAPALNMQKLSATNPVITNPEIRKGNFADSIVILYGTDCIQVTQTLISYSKKYAVIKTDFHRIGFQIG